MKGRLALGVLLGAFFLWLSMRQVDLGETWVILRKAKYGHFVLFVFLNLLSLWIRAVRWSVLLRPMGRFPSARLLSPLSIGFMGNLIFPARAGEFIRAYLLGQREGVSKSSAFATVVVERLFDGLAIISFLALAPFFLVIEDGLWAARLRWAGLGVLLFYLLVLTVLLLLSHNREACATFLGRFSFLERSRIGSRLVEMLRSFIDGLAVLRCRGDAFSAISLSYVVWGLFAFTNYLMMNAVGLSLPLYAAFFLVVMQSFGVMVPSPGYVGSYQYAHIVALALYGVDRSTAFSLAILIHAGFFLAFMGAGIFYLLRDHVSLGEVRRAGKEEPPP